MVEPEVAVTGYTMTAGDHDVTIRLEGPAWLLSGGGEHLRVWNLSQEEVMALASEMLEWVCLTRETHEAHRAVSDNFARFLDDARLAHRGEVLP